MDYNDLSIDVRYISINKEDKDLGIKVNTVGFQTINSNTQYPARIHPAGYYFSSQGGRVLNEFQLIYITKGKGRLSIDNKQFDIKEGSIFLLYPNQWHSYAPNIETGWNEYYIGFEGKIIFDWIENSFLETGNQVYNIGFNDGFVKLYRRAIELAKFKNQSMSLYLSGLIYNMIGLLIYEINNKDIKTNELQLIERAKIIMNENVYKDIYPKELAEKLGMNYTSFRKQFKKITGFAPGTYFNELKISKAKQLLLESSLPIKEISIRLQFNSSDYFNVIFKKKTGYTPNEYRSVTR